MERQELIGGRTFNGETGATRWEDFFWISGVRLLMERRDLLGGRPFNGETGATWWEDF